VRMTERKGWGLFTTEPIPQGHHDIRVDATGRCQVSIFFGD